MAETSYTPPCLTGNCEYTQGNPGYLMIDAVGKACIDLMNHLQAEDSALEILPGDCPYAVLQAEDEARLADQRGEF